jgi:3-mercaptopyruvate sulfurtransferase SseA
MRSLAIAVGLTALLVWSAAGLAAQTERRYPVDPQTRWAVGAKLKPADELKKELEAGRMLIIDVRGAEQFQKESLPGAINIPLAELEGHLKKMAKDTYIVFT